MPKGNSVRLPEQWEAHTVSSMMPTDERWAYPSAMSVDMEGFCWLDPDDPVFSLDPEDGELIRIVRDENGFSVLIPEGFSLRWYRQELSVVEEESEEVIGWIAVLDIREFRVQK